MLKIDFSLSGASRDEAEFRSYLEQRSPDGVRVVDSMARHGISLADEREAFLKVRALQDGHKPSRT